MLLIRMVLIVPTTGWRLPSLNILKRCQASALRIHNRYIPHHPSPASNTIAPTSRFYLLSKRETKLGVRWLDIALKHPRKATAIQKRHRVASQAFGPPHSAPPAQFKSGVEPPHSKLDIPLQTTLLIKLQIKENTPWHSKHSPARA